MCNNKAFTLVELLVGISLSMLLMMSVGIFVSTGMSNIKLQTDVLNDATDITAGYNVIQQLISSSEGLIWSGGAASSGVLLKINPEYDNGTYAFIGTRSQNKAYCSTGETLDFDHMYSSTFVPYEEIGEDINLDFSLTQTSSIVTIASTDYRSDISQHGIFQYNGTTWDRIIGNEIFGNKLTQGDSGDSVYLNSPTGLIEVDGKLVFSDTLNNRVLYYSGSQVYTLLDERDGLDEPTGLAYDATNKTLFIANSGAGEILLLSSESHSTNPPLEIAFTPENDFDANNFSISVHTGAINLTGPLSSADYTFTNITKNVNNMTRVSGNTLDYVFRDSVTAETGGNLCTTTTGFLYTSSDIIRCSTTETGTGEVLSTSLESFVTSTQYGITVNNITPNFSSNQSYYIELTMRDNDAIEYKKIFPYFTQGDDDIFTKDDNILTVFTGGLNYPTGIEVPTSGPVTLKVNLFEGRELLNLNASGNAPNPGVPLTAFSQGTFDGGYKKDYSMKNPVKDLDIVYDGSTDKLLHMNLKYYKYLNCYNNDENIERTFLFKKAYK